MEVEKSYKRTDKETTQQEGPKVWRPFSTGISSIGNIIPDPPERKEEKGRPHLSLQTEGKVKCDRGSPFVRREVHLTAPDPRVSTINDPDSSLGRTESD